MSAFLWHTAITIAHILPTVLGYNLLFGRGKVLHFGPYCVSLCTGYSLYLVVMQTGNYWIGLLAAATAAASISILFSLLSQRLEADAFGVLSIALHLMALAFVLNADWLTNGARGLPGIPRFPGLENPTVFGTVALLSALVFIYLFWRVQHSVIGRGFAALAEHPWYGEAVGIQRHTIYTIGFLLLALAHLNGNFFYVQQLYLLHPNDYNFPGFLFILVMAVAGTPGSVVGSSLAVVLLVALKESLRFLPIQSGIIGPLQVILFGLVLFAVVWIRRENLFPKTRSI